MFVIKKFIILKYFNSVSAFYSFEFEVIRIIEDLNYRRIDEALASFLKLSNFCHILVYFHLIISFNMKIFKDCAMNIYEY